MVRQCQASLPILEETSKRQPEVFLGQGRDPLAAERAGKSTGQRVQGLGLCPAPPPPAAQFRPVSPPSSLGCRAESLPLVGWG